MRTKVELENHIDAGRSSDHRKVANNTYAIRTHDIAGNEGVGIQLHKTVIAFFRDDGLVQLTTGGWNTVTTRDRLNRFAPSGIRVWTRDKVCYFSSIDEVVRELGDGAVFTDWGNYQFHENNYVFPDEYVCSITDKNYRSWKNAKDEREKWLAEFNRNRANTRRIMV